jgi:hypothetical protein
VRGLFDQGMVALVFLGSIAGSVKQEELGI